jgi:uncharacterized protein (TIGR00369 family)
MSTVETSRSKRIILQMPSHQLPHTLGCLVCGRDNPHGLRLDLHVDTETNIVRTDFTPDAHHIGFEGIIHGGVLATVLDEAMVWAATWSVRRFCVCAEMTVRFLTSAEVNQKLCVEAKLTSDRRVMLCEGKVLNPAGETIALSTGKYIRVPEDRNRDVLATLVDNYQTREATHMLRGTTTNQT